MATPMSASLSASTSLTPSPVMATVWPSACRAWTMARFWSGATRPKIDAAAIRSDSAAVSSGSVRASTGWSAPAIPSVLATAATDTALSPDMIFSSTFSAAK